MALAVCLLSARLGWTQSAADGDAPGDKSTTDTDKQKGAPPEFKALPLATYSPDTSFAGGGLGVMFFDMPGESGRQSSANLVGLYTAKHQMSGQLKWELALDNEDWLIRGRTKAGIWPDDYHGVGADAPADGETYDSRFVEHRLGIRRRVPGAPNLYAGLLHSFHTRSITADDGSRLAAQAPSGSQGGRLSGLGAELVYDRRDSRYSPHRGMYAAGRLTWYTSGLGSEFDFAHLTGDGRRYWDLGGGHSIGVRGRLELQFGDVPFFEMATLGGSKLNRGISGDRFRDRALLAGQIEYRSPMLWRFAFSTFASLGQIAPSVSSLMGATPKWAAGGGVRFFVDTERRIPLRLDLGFSRDNAVPDIYFSIGEAF